MSITYGGSGGYDAFAEQLNDNTVRSENNESKNTEQDGRLDQAELDIQQNTEAIENLEGSLEIKAFLTVVNPTPITLLAGIQQALTFDKGIETDPTVLGYDEATNVFTITTGITYTDTRYVFGSALTGANTNVTVKIIDVITSAVLSQSTIVVPQGSTGYQIRLSKLLNVTANVQYRAEMVADRNIIVTTVDVIGEKSLTNSVETNAISIHTVATESPSGTATKQDEANIEFTDLFKKTEKRTLLFDYLIKDLGNGGKFVYGQTLTFLNDIGSFDKYEFTIEDNVGSRWINILISKKTGNLSGLVGFLRGDGTIENVYMYFIEAYTPDTIEYKNNRYLLQTSASLTPTTNGNNSTSYGAITRIIGINE